ncbi:MAG: Panacea domain-containing protein [Syntrophales bacterium]
MDMSIPRYNVADIADYFLFKAQDDDQELLSNLKLQKLVYYSQGLHLAVFNRPLFRETIYAWQYGPVVPDLYHSYKQWGAGGIPARQEFDPSVIDPETSEFIDEIYEAFGQFSAIRLMELTHTDQCWIDAGINNEISLDSMKTTMGKYLDNG